MASNLKKVSMGASATAASFGLLGMVAPHALGKAYGLDMTDGESQYLVRIFSTRNAVLGALGLAMINPGDRGRLNLAVAAMNTVDGILALTSGGLRSGTRWRGPLTQFGFAAMAYIVGIQGE